MPENGSQGRNMCYRLTKLVKFVLVLSNTYVNNSTWRVTHDQECRRLACHNV